MPRMRAAGLGSLLPAAAAASPHACSASTVKKAAPEKTWTTAPPGPAAAGASAAASRARLRAKRQLTLTRSLSECVSRCVASPGYSAPATRSSARGCMLRPPRRTTVGGPSSGACEAARARGRRLLAAAGRAAVHRGAGRSTECAARSMAAGSGRTADGGRGGERALGGGAVAAAARCGQQAPTLHSAELYNNAAQACSASALADG